MLQLKNIQKDYSTASEVVHALRGISLSFRQCEFVSILGPSGCGKTTLLNIIGGLDHYTAGDLVIAGRSTTSYGDRDWDVYRNHRIGFIFQSYNLIPHQTVLGNVELALTIAGVSREERTRRAKAVLDRVGLEGQYYKKPNQLSGGQCQRVAIARALVNDPEILLADEPTGALDTVTSVQIMDLIREISGERLVIMVTHNPELAEKYSSRIVRLLDGRVIQDTNPFSPEEEEAECAAAREREAAAEAAAIAAAQEGITDPEERARKEKEVRRGISRKKEKAKMSFFTAFLLSARNLISKKGRTAMVGIAGSIGIIGIALVLAFSAGIKGYVVSMQDDMLSGNPITISESTYDLNALNDMMSAEQKEEIIKQPNRVYIDSLVDYLVRMDKNVSSLLIENEITPEYIRYVMAMPEEYYAAMLYEYGMDISLSIYTDFADEVGGESRNLSIKALMDIYTSLIGETDYAQYASYITSVVPSFQQAPGSADYIAGQYDLTAGRIATEKNEIMLVLDRDEELSDILLARLGYYTQDEFITLIKRAAGEEYDEALYRDSFTYDELLGKSFTWYPNDVIFRPSSTGSSLVPYNYLYNSADFADGSEGLELEVVGILTAKENVSYGCLSSGIYYTGALAEYILEKNLHSDFVEYLSDPDACASMATTYYNLPYVYRYHSAVDGKDKVATGAVGASDSGLLGGLLGGGLGGFGGFGGTGSSGGSMTGIDANSLRLGLIRALGGNDVPNHVSIYPLSFDSKYLVTDYLSAWNNDDLTLTVGEETIPPESRDRITYTDTLDLVINMINTMINIISYALIAFTSISLVVSTVMIGIITYVSVVERIKEIGVIRALGGRKKDVSHLFNAETAIIGVLAGLFGVVVTYLVSAVVNAILYPLIGISHIAALPFSNAVVMVLLSLFLTSISGLIPAASAARKDPVVALRTE